MVSSTGMPSAADGLEAPSASANVVPFTMNTWSDSGELLGDGARRAVAIVARDSFDAPTHPLHLVDDCLADGPWSTEDVDGRHRHGDSLQLVACRLGQFVRRGEQHGSADFLGQRGARQRVGEVVGAGEHRGRRQHRQGSRRG